MKFAVLVFPGSNCDIDMHHAIEGVLGEEVAYVSHDETSLAQYDAVLVPGGATYGNYLRPGALAVHTNIMSELKEFVATGKPVLAVNNGFQILTEAGILPGGFLRNKGLKFMCQTVELTVENNDTLFTKGYAKGEVIRVPLANEYSNYFCDEATLAKLQQNNQIIFTYNDNPNGSVANIAAVTNEQGNVLGVMPSVERAVEEIIGGTDGLTLFKSIVKQWGEQHVNK